MVHIICRFERAERRLDVNGARRAYLERLACACKQTDTLLLAYVLMSTHVHLCVEVRHLPLSALMQRLNGAFAQWSNRREEKFGHVFAERYHTVEIPSEAAGIVIAYIHNNEVRAGLVPSALHGRWSSHGFFVRGNAPEWLHVEHALLRCGFDDSLDGIVAFDTFVNGRAELPPSPHLVMGGPDEAQRLAQLRRDGQEALRECAYRRQSGRTSSVVIHDSAPSRPVTDADEFVEVAGLTLDVSIPQLRRGRRNRTDSRRRAAIAYAWHNLLGGPQIEIAKALCVSEAAVSKMVRRVQGDPACEELVSKLSSVGFAGPPLGRDRAVRPKS